MQLDAVIPGSGCPVASTGSVPVIRGRFQAVTEGR
jgi:hypothetical protein